MTTWVYLSLHSVPTISIHFWLRLALWLLFGGATISGVVLLVNERLKEQLESGMPKRGFALRRLVMVATGERALRQANKVWLLLFGITLGFTMGFGYRNYQLVNNTHTYLDVQVLDRYAPDKYLLQPARMQPWISKTCEPVDLTVGHTMKFYTYEQLADCHRVKSFVFYTNRKGERTNVTGAAAVSSWRPPATAAGVE